MSLITQDLDGTSVSKPSPDDCVTEADLAAFWRVTRFVNTRNPGTIAGLPRNPNGEALLRFLVGMDDDQNARDLMVDRLEILGIPIPYAKKLASLPATLLRRLKLDNKPIA
jgi:hypothetical protein